jgi:hypothetical protein
LPASARAGSKSIPQQARQKKEGNKYPMHIIQSPLFDFEAFIQSKGIDRLVNVLEALPAEQLLAALEKEHWTGRKGYSVRGCGVFSLLV